MANLQVEYNSALLTGIDTTLQFVRRQLSSAEVLLLNTNPITLVAAKSGVTFVPRYMFFQKPAGTAYTIAGITQIAIRVGTSSIGGPGAAGLLDSSSATSIVMYGPGSASALYSGTDLGALQNLALNIFSAGANPAAGNSPLNLLVFYNEFPISFAT